LWLVLASAGCWTPAASPQAAATTVLCDQAVVLASLPQNSDQRCVGIALVLETLLETSSLDADVCLSAQSVADRLYAEAAVAGPGPLPQFIERDETRNPLLSPTGLEWLSTLVADRYKQDHTRTVDAGGAERLARAMTTFVPSAERLKSLLRDDADRAVVFGGVGLRELPDREERETFHAFVLQLQPAGQIRVYDPNDPQAIVRCDVEDDIDGVLATWTCRYRDTGLVTTQTYRLVPMKDFFRAAFVAEAE
jgi:hypothetical protein